MPLHRPSPAALSALPAPPPIMSGWRIGSFSALIGAARSEAAAHDRDAHVADAKPIGSPPPDLANDDILRFPRGPRAGECLHAIFERIDFRDDAGWGIAIERALAAYPQLVPGVRASEQPALLARIARVMLGDVLAAKLPDGIVLAEIPKARCLAELEFNLPSSGITASGLNSALAALGYRVPRLAFRDIEGYLKGVIDLVFEHRGRYYIVDWKSNHLGYARDDYAPAALASAMADHSYHLQYLIYALALDRYLRTRIDGYRHDAHFGGVLYLFVRGMRARWNDGSGAPCGVFHHRPTASTLARLDAVFGALRDGAAP